MINLIDIKKAIIGTLKHSLKLTDDFKNVVVIGRECSEQIIRPSIKLDIESFKGGKFNSCIIEKNIKMSLYFFAKDRTTPNVDNLYMQDFLYNVFLNDIMIKKDFYITIEEVDFNTSDGVLICNFEVNIFENNHIEKGEEIEKLEI